jgi:hypothetical protein
MFSVEAAGKEVEERESEENLLQKFVDYITVKKEKNLIKSQDSKSGYARRSCK